MKRKVLCVALALLMCMAVTLPTFADGSAETQPERALAAFGLHHNSGSYYTMWAKLSNPDGNLLVVKLELFDAAYNQIAVTGTISSDTVIQVSKGVTLSTGTYYLRLSYGSSVSNGIAVERTYYI